MTVDREPEPMDVRLCYVYLYPILLDRGNFATTVPIRQSQMLAGTGAQISVLYNGALNIDRLAQSGIDSYSYGGRSLLRYLSLVRRQIWLARHNRVDVFMNVWAHYALFPIWVGARLSGTKLIARVAGVPVAAAPLSDGVSLSRRLRRWLGLRLERFSLASADGVCALSLSLKQMVVERGASADKVFVVPQGVNTSLFRPSIVHKGLRERVILFVGRLTAVKDLPTALRAFCLVKEELPDVQFVIIGSGEQRDSLGRLAASLQLSDSVSFKGFVPHDQLAAEYTQACLFVLPSLSEGLPNTILEAQACGLPVVATPVGENSRLLADRRGHLVPIGDHRKMAAAILQLLEDEGARRDMGRRARAFVEANYSFDAVRRAYQRMLEAVID